MLVEGIIAEMTAKLDPTKSIKHIWYNKQASQCYMCIALYGPLQAAYLIWKPLLKTLQERVFVLNPYN